jgi:hypothetical protein
VTKASEFCCPRCGAPLEPRGPTSIECQKCPATFPRVEGVWDLRVFPDREIEPVPLASSDFAFAFQCHASGQPYKAVLEALLLSLDDERAERLMLLLRESRGAWYPLLAAHGGECLFLGNALSGTITPLANAGFLVSVLDPSSERVRFASMRSETHSPGRVRALIGGDGPRLPFQDGAFDLVVQEDGVPGPDGGCGPFGHDLGECLRVARGEVVLGADNRLAYKRSSGKRADFRVPSPLAYARAIFSRRGERTLGGYRRMLSAPAFSPARAFALYPDARDFSHVVGLDAPTPRLTIGPLERKNRVKLLARKLGLFPVLTPSFALITARRTGSAASPRIDRILAQLAERIREPTPAIEQLVATRRNTAVIHTSDGDHETGRWTLHISLCPNNVPEFEWHARSLADLRERFPALPVPEPLFAGRIDGIALTCERRIPGWSAAQIGGGKPMATMLAETAAHFAELVVRRAAPLTVEEFDARIAPRFELVARHAAVPSTIANLARLCAETRERLVGRPLALVRCHADLRSKHVQVDEDGHVLAYLDWSTNEPEGLPYYDLLHLMIHQRKREDGCSAGDAWRRVCAREELRDHERACLDSYTRTVGLESDVARAIEAMYPVLIGAMVESNWEYSRPRWLHRHFDL